MATVGIIASPSAGKDVRRLVGHAGSTGDVDKIAVIRRAALGVIESNVDRLLYLDDTDISFNALLKESRMEMCKSNQSIKLSWERVEIQKKQQKP